MPRKCAMPPFSRPCTLPAAVFAITSATYPTAPVRGLAWLASRGVEHWEGDVVTSDGGIVHVRPVQPDDASRIEAFHARQSAESIYYRYFSARPRLSAAEIEKLVNVDGVDRAAFVALLDDDIIGIARYDRYSHRDE